MNEPETAEEIIRELATKSVGCVCETLAKINPNGLCCITCRARACMNKKPRPTLRERVEQRARMKQDIDRFVKGAINASELRRLAQEGL